MAVGGQGAPLAPAFHVHAFALSGDARAVLNIGGIANITVLPKHRGTPIGFDTGPGNCLLDEWTAAGLGKAFDEDGAWAATGAAQPQMLRRLLADAYFELPPPKSTGREYFNLGWLRQCLSGEAENHKAADVQATLLQLTSQSVSNALHQYAGDVDKVFVCGGGAKNPVLMDALRDSLRPMTVATTAALGIDPDAVEAVAFAWLARQRLLSLPGNLRSVTGATRDAVLGGLYLPPK